MQVTVEEISPIKRKMEIVIPRKKVVGDLNNAYSLLRKNARIKGFRPGKVPRAILERMYKTQVENEVANTLINDAYPKAIEEKNINPLGVPAIEKDPLSDQSDFKFSVTFEVNPHVELQSYKNMELEKEKLILTDEMVLNRLEEIRTAHGHLEPVEEDRPLEQGDTALVNYQGYENGKPIENVKNENFPITLGENRFNETFEKELVGTKKGGSKEVEIDFPQDFMNPALAGKKVLIKAEVLDIKKRKLPELDDEFAKDLGEDFQTLEDLKAKLREQIEKEETDRIQGNVYKQIRKKLVESHEFEVPDTLVDLQVRQMISNLEQNLRQRGLNFESAGLVIEKLTEDYRAPAEEQVRSSLILESIAGEESIEVGDEDLDDAYQKLADQIGQKKEIIEKFYNENNMIEGLKQRISEEKTLQFIMEHASIIEVEPKPGEEQEEKTPSKPEKEDI